MQRIQLSFAVGALLLAACDQTGALQQAEVSAACDPDDVVCSTLGLDAPVATGSTLNVEVSATSPGVATSLIQLETALPGIATVEGQLLTGVSPGMTALLVSGEGDLVIDFVHIFVAAPTRLGMFRSDGAIATTLEIDRPIELLTGDEIVVSLAPYRDSERLLGQVEATWWVDGVAVSMLSEGIAGRRRLVAREPGTVRVGATAMDFGAEITVEVMP